MITVKEADQIIFGDIKEFSSCRIPLQEAFGMVLREDLVADRNLPPFHRATMDGIAINFSSWKSGNHPLRPPQSTDRGASLPSSALLEKLTNRSRRPDLLPPPDTQQVADAALR